jgi:hypothetical protein
MLEPRLGASSTCGLVPRNFASHHTTAAMMSNGMIRGTTKTYEECLRDASIPNSLEKQIGLSIQPANKASIGRQRKDYIWMEVQINDLILGYYEFGLRVPPMMKKHKSLAILGHQIVYYKLTSMLKVNDPQFVMNPHIDLFYLPWTEVEIRYLILNYYEFGRKITPMMKKR